MPPAVHPAVRIAGSIGLSFENNRNNGKDNFFEASAPTGVAISDPAHGLVRRSPGEGGCAQKKIKLFLKLFMLFPLSQPPLECLPQYRLPHLHAILYLPRVVLLKCFKLSF